MQAGSFSLKVRKAKKMSPLRLKKTVLGISVETLKTVLFF